MAISSSLISGASFIRAETLIQNQDRLSDLNRQLATGERATTYGGLGAERSQSVSIRQDVSRLEAFQSNVDRVNLRIDVAGLSLERLEDIRVESRAAINPNNFVDLGNGTTFTQQSADAALAETVALLNSQSDGRYIFGGNDVLSPPIADLQTILNGDGIRAGLRQVTDERLAADLGADGLGRLDLSINPTTPTIVNLAEEAGIPFGFDIVGIESNLSGVTSSVADSEVRPAALTFDTAGFDDTTAFDITLDGETLSFAGRTDATLDIDTTTFDGTSEFTLNVGGETIVVAAGQASDAATLQSTLNDAVANNPNLTAQSLNVGVVGTTISLTSEVSDITVTSPAGTGVVAADSAVDGTQFFAAQASDLETFEASLSDAIAANLNLTGDDLAFSSSGTGIVLTSAVDDITTVAGTNGPGNLTTAGGAGGSTSFQEATTPASLSFDTTAFDNTTSFDVVVDGETILLAGGTNAVLGIDTSGFDGTSAFTLSVDGETIPVTPGQANDAATLETTLNNAITANPALSAQNLVVSVAGGTVNLTSGASDIAVTAPAGAGVTALDSSADGTPFVAGEASDIATLQSSLGAAVAGNPNLTGGDLLTSVSGSTITLVSDASDISTVAGVNGPGTLTTAGGANAFVDGANVELPASVTVNFQGQPVAGETFNLLLNLPDGTQETITLIADGFSSEPGSFAIGATEAESAANFEAALRDQLGFEARTDLNAASRVVSADNFFNTDGGRLPQRVDTSGGSVETATGFVDATADDTFFYYTGQNDAEDPRSSATTRVDDTIVVNYGLRANEDGLRGNLTSLAAFAIGDFTSSTEFENQQIHNSLAERTRDNLAVQVNEPSLRSVVQELAGIQIIASNADERHSIAVGALTTLRVDIERADPTETAIQLLSLQSQIEVSFEASSRISQLSLLNFIN